MTAPHTCANGKSGANPPDEATLRGQRPRRHLAGIADLVGRLGRTMVAEDIATGEQCALLRGAGVTSGQGFNLDPPGPARELTRLLACIAGGHPRIPTRTGGHRER